MRRSRLVRAVMVVTLLVTGWFLLGDRALAIQESKDRVLFGPLGVGAGQGARINVYGVGNPNDAPWQFAVRIFNRRGEVVQSREFQLAPGVVGSFEVSIGNPDTLPVDRLGRRTLRAEIVGFQPPPDPGSPPPDPDSLGRYAATLEVYSQLTGHTSILLGGPDTLPALQPPPEPDSRQ